MKADEIYLPNPRYRNLYLNKQVDQDSIGELTKEIININEEDEHIEKLYDVHNLAYKPKPIKIFIDSYGGSVYQCLGLISIIEKSKIPIHTIAIGAAMSAGFDILICGHKRFCYSLATIMYHQVFHRTSGETKKMEEDLIETKRLQKKMEDMVIAKTKITKEKLKEVYKSKIDWYMSARQALKYGVVDKIL